MNGVFTIFDKRTFADRKGEDMHPTLRLRLVHRTALLHLLLPPPVHPEMDGPLRQPLLDMELVYLCCKTGKQIPCGNQSRL
jgi:hypothetical protein